MVVRRFYTAAASGGNGFHSKGDEKLVLEVPVLSRKTRRRKTALSHAHRKKMGMEGEGSSLVGEGRNFKGRVGRFSGMMKF